MAAKCQNDPGMQRYSKNDPITACPKTPLAREQPLLKDKPDRTHTGEQMSQKAGPENISTGDQPNQHDISQNHSATAVLRRPLLSFAWNCVLIFAPIAFIGLGIASAVLDGKQQSSTGRSVQYALLLSPTIFPIVFAALVGNFMKVLALYRSQTGLEMRMLEYLVGAQSLFSALQRQVMLRNFGLISICVTSFWLLSPVGGQAFLRLLTTAPTELRLDNTFYYLHPLSYLSMSGFQGVSSLQSSLGTIKTAYLSSLVTPIDVQDSPRDLWGNGKIPSLDSLTGRSSTEGEWIDVKQGNTKYSNLIGIPVDGLVAEAESAFVIESLHMSFNCSSNIRTTFEDFTSSTEPLWLFRNRSFYSSLFSSPDLTSSKNTSTSFFCISNSSMYGIFDDIFSPLTVYFGSQDYANISLAKCSMSLLATESRVMCSGKDCAATAMRVLEDLEKSSLYRSDITYLNYMIDNFRLTAVRQWWTAMGNSLHNGENSQTELFISNPSNVLSGVESEIWKVDLEDLSLRLSQAYNSFLYAASTRDFVSGLQNTSNRANATGTTVRETGTVYICHKHWLVIALVISAALEAVAIASAALVWMTRVPDIFGYVSSLIIENPYCISRGIRGSTALNGLERARKYGKVVFRIGDVKKEEEVGHIAFLPVVMGDKAGEIK